jgi:ribose 5-phosphate isomerase B
VRVALASDHAGFELKEFLKPRLGVLDVAIVDCGCFSKERVDYFDFTLVAARSVLDGSCDIAIGACGNGFAMAMLANRLPGIRAAVCHDVLSARTVREMGNANFLAFGARVVAPETAWELARLALQSEFRGDETPRYARRLERLAALERSILRPDWQHALERLGTDATIEGGTNGGKD